MTINCYVDVVYGYGQALSFDPARPSASLAATIEHIKNDFKPGTKVNVHLAPGLYHISSLKIPEWITLIKHGSVTTN